MFSLRNLVTLLVGASALLSQPVHGNLMRKKELHARQAEAAKRWVTSPHRRDTTAATANNTAASNTIAFKNPKAARWSTDIFP